MRELLKWSEKLDASFLLVCLARIVPNMEYVDNYRSFLR